MAEFDLETDGLTAEKEQLAEQVGALGTDLRKTRRRLEDLARSSEALESQLMDVVEVLLPQVEFLRDSRKVILRELSSFRPVFAELHQMAANRELKGTAVEGAHAWRERHFSTGQKDDGRLYYKRQDRKWVVLVSFKGEQKADVRWLGKW